jgi:hypothetical protein
MRGTEDDGGNITAFPETAATGECVTITATGLPLLRRLSVLYEGPTETIRKSEGRTKGTLEVSDKFYAPGTWTIRIMRGNKELGATAITVIP